MDLSRWSPSQAAARRRAKRKSNLFARIDVSGFAGVMLALLMLFIGDVRPAHQRWSVDLPRVRNTTSQPGALREDVIVVAVTRDGRFYFRGVTTTADDMPDLIRAALQSGSERKIYLYADERCRNADVDMVLDQMQRVGIAHIATLAEKKLKQPAD
jgi:biopolymer transport protein TolR